jgi:hypothetical protein
MKIHLDNTGVEIDPPSPVGPCQTLSERMGEPRPEPVVAGKLSAEHRAILEEPDGLDRREFNYLIESGQGFLAAFKAAAGMSPVSPFAKHASGEEPVARVEHDGDCHSEYAVDGRLLRCWFGSSRPDFEGMHKILQKNGVAQKADKLMEDYRRSGANGLPTIVERMTALAEAALPFLSADLAEKLMKAVRAMDVDLVYFFCTKALIQQAA